MIALTVRQAKADQQIRVVQQPWQRTVVESWAYGERGPSSFSERLELELRDVPHVQDLWRVLEPLRESTTSSEALDELAAAGAARDSASFHLEQLLMRAGDSAWRDQPLSERHAKRFIDDVAGRRLPNWRVVVAFTGLPIEDAEPVVLARNTWIRRSVPADVERERWLELPNAMAAQRETPSAFLELSARGGSQSDLRRKMKQWVMAIQLGLPTAACVLSESIASDSLIHRGGTSGTTNPQRPAKVETVGRAQLIELRSLRLLLDRADSSPAAPSFDVAWTHLTKALTGSNRAEERIAEAMASLEAALLEQGAEGEALRRLRQRLAIAARAAGHDPLAVSTLAKDAYNVRSRYVHGGSFTRKQREAFSNLVPFAVDAARFGLLCLVCGSSLDKDKWTAVLDRALLSDESFRELRTMLARSRSWMPRISGVAQNSGSRLSPD